MNLLSIGNSKASLTTEDIRQGVVSALEKLGIRKKVLVIPPDFTRFHSHAGPVTRIIYGHYGKALTDILPALGTHAPMSAREIETMYPGVPAGLFRVHDWRNDIQTLGEVPSEFVSEVSEGKVNYPWKAQVNRMLFTGGYDLILSVGQVVPHEVAGMANHSKNIFVGTGGSEGINKSHFLGAVYGMEKMMGRVINPVRKVLNYASTHFLDLPVVYILTVVGTDEKGRPCMHGLFIGDDHDTFLQAAALSLEVNFTMLEQPLDRVVVYLDPDEFKSTWLGNKSIYRTRMAMADGGELIVLAPGVKMFGEDRRIDRLIRKYGYRPAEDILNYVEQDAELADNLGAAAHIIHGSPDGRFSITYATPHLSGKEIHSVGFRHADLTEMMGRYPVSEMKDGWNTLKRGGKLFYISNPALGLWSTRARFTDK